MIAIDNLNSESLEKVSCLCISEFRVDNLKFSYQLYRSQLYQNKELIVIYSQDDIATTHFIALITKSDTSVVGISLENSSAISLGSKRNIAIKAASGQYICNWDDDDIYHPDRISASIGSIYTSKKNAVVLSNVILYDKNVKQAFLSKRRCWEQTIFCSKNFITKNNIYYSDLNKGEDVNFIAQMADSIFILCNPILYIYVFHKKNTCDANHFNDHFLCSTRLSAENNIAIANCVDQTVSISQFAAQLNSINFWRSMELVGSEFNSWWGVKPFCHYPQLLNLEDS